MRIALSLIEVLYSAFRNDSQTCGSQVIKHGWKPKAGLHNGQMVSCALCRIIGIRRADKDLTRQGDFSETNSLNTDFLTSGPAEVCDITKFI
jgi:hypothetical protein